jgi:hypothetical protein
MEVVTPVPAVGAPFVNNGGQLVAHEPEQVLMPGVSLVNAYRVMPLESTRNEPRVLFWLTCRRAGADGDALDISVGTGVLIALPVIGITGAEVAGIAVAVGAAEPQADTITIISARRAENNILFFIRNILDKYLRLLQVPRIDIKHLYYLIIINFTLVIIIIPCNEYFLIKGFCPQKPPFETLRKEVFGVLREGLDLKNERTTRQSSFGLGEFGLVDKPHMDAG